MFVQARFLGQRAEHTQANRVIGAHRRDHRMTDPATQRTAGLLCVAFMPPPKS